MINRVCRIVLLVSVAAGSILAGGCGDDEEPFIPPSGPIIIPIRQGTWSIQEVSTYTGDDSCTARDPAFVDTTDVLCYFGIGETPSSFFLTDCEVDTADGEVLFDCTIRANLGICVQLIDIVGNGTVTDTTFDLSSMLVTRLIPAEGVSDSTCERFYGNFIDACSTWIESEGTWLSSSTVIGVIDTVTKACPEPPCDICACGPCPEPEEIGLETFIRGVALEDLWRR